MTEKQNNTIFISFLAASCLLIGSVIMEKLQPAASPVPGKAEQAGPLQPLNVIGLPQDTARLKEEFERKGITPHPAAHWKVLEDTP